MRKVWAVLALVVLALGCGKEEVYDVAAQLAIDVENIDAHLASEGITPNIDQSFGIRYVITTPGDGTGAQPGDIASVNYELYNFAGDLLDTNVEDVARAAGIFSGNSSKYVPLTFVVSSGQLITGFSRSVELLSTTGSGDFYIPSVFAYQNRGSGNIAPNESLLFKIELLEVID